MQTTSFLHSIANYLHTLQVTQDFRFIFRVDWMQGRGCAQQYT